MVHDVLWDPPPLTELMMPTNLDIVHILVASDFQVENYFLCCQKTFHLMDDNMNDNILTVNEKLKLSILLVLTGVAVPVGGGTEGGFDGSPDSAGPILVIGTELTVGCAFRTGLNIAGGIGTFG